MFKQHLQQLRIKLAESGIDVALITDDDSVYYYSGYYDYLHMEFGRPTLLLVTCDGESLLITPAIDENMALEHARVDRIEAWNDGLGREWRRAGGAAFGRRARHLLQAHLLHGLPSPDQRNGSNPSPTCASHARPINSSISHPWSPVCA